MTSYFHLVVRHAQINLGNKNMKIGIFTGATSVRSKNIFTNISRYPTGKHEINSNLQLFYSFTNNKTLCIIQNSKNLQTKFFKCGLKRYSLFFYRLDNIVEKGGKAGLPAFFSFSYNILKYSVFKIVKSRDGAVESERCGQSYSTAPGGLL